MGQPLFSIVIPTLNEEHYLPKLLEDLVRQTEQNFEVIMNFEVIIVDGNSYDQTKQVAESFSHKLPFHFYTVKKRNVSYQRNYGGRIAQGQYLLFLDADARVTSQFTKRLLYYFQKKHTSLVLPTLKNENKQLSDKLLFQFANGFITFSKLMNKPISAGGCLFVDKKVFTALKGFNEKLLFSEDHDLVQRIFKKGYIAEIAKDISVVFSSRRIDKEGKLLFISKMLYIYFYQLFNIKVKDPIVSYEMGGGHYNYTTKNSKMTRNDQWQN
jgi:glycosyltransferase involved in cell wall biosynthesis